MLEAGLVSVFACLPVAIVVMQQARSERVLYALCDLTSPRAVVMVSESAGGAAG